MVETCSPHAWFDSTWTLCKCWCPSMCLQLAIAFGSRAERLCWTRVVLHACGNPHLPQLVLRVPFTGQSWAMRAPCIHVRAPFSQDKRISAIRRASACTVCRGNREMGEAGKGRRLRGCVRPAENLTMPVVPQVRYRGTQLVPGHHQASQPLLALHGTCHPRRHGRRVPRGEVRRLQQPGA